MDTHITDRPEIQVEGTEEAFSHATGGPDTDRLSSFRSLNEGEPRPPEATAPTPARKSRRNGLMITACAIVVLAAASGVFWISPYNHTSMADLTRVAGRAETAVLAPMHSAVGQNPSVPAPVAPAARLARAPEPSAPTPLRVPPPALDGIRAVGDDMAEFLRLGGQTTAMAPPALAKRVEPPSVLSKPPAGQALASHDQDPAGVDPHVPSAAVATPKAPVVASLPPAIVEHANSAPKTAAPEQHPAGGSATVPNDLVTAIATLRPAPMTDAQQIQVLDLVTQLGTLVRDQRAQITALRQDQQNLVERVDSSLNDFTRRISLSEARGALGAAAGEPRPIQAAAAAPVIATPVAARVAVPIPVSAPVDTGPHRYHVQAASPGLAMLSELDASGGEQRQLPISPGDTVPGWGKVVSISQRGTSWVVKTDRGLIQ